MSDKKNAHERLDGHYYTVKNSFNCLCVNDFITVDISTEVSAHTTIGGNN